MKSISITLTFIIFFFLFSCKTAKENTNSLLNDDILNSECVKSLNLEKQKLSDNNLEAIKQFVSQNSCNKETSAFIRSTIKSLQNGDISNVSLACLNRHFETNQNSPFNVAFGGVFTCENYGL